MGLLYCFVLLQCFCLCVPQLTNEPFDTPLVSPDSYIANQSSFSSINDKDLHYYKNLRNLWVFYSLHYKDRHFGSGNYWTHLLKKVITHTFLIYILCFLSILSLIFIYLALKCSFDIYNGTFYRATIHKQHLKHWEDLFHHK